MPALRWSITTQQLYYMVEDDGTAILSKSLKDEQWIYTVQSLNWKNSFEGVLTYAEPGRPTKHVDGGLVITAGPPIDVVPFSYIAVNKPRLTMALLLRRLFPEDEPYIAKAYGVTIGENTSIGHPGFGWVRDTGNYIRFPHVAGVVIGPRTTIGANTTICRGSLSDTIIGADCHIDDHVHIAHGVVLGNHVIVVANAMIAGSVVVEDDVWIGPSASIMQGVRIGEGATIGMGAVVLRDVLPGETIVGVHRVIPTKDKQVGVTR
jgi:acetyltransferase-like isoleucine patch superfamily enzyme